MDTNSEEKIKMIEFLKSSDEVLSVSEFSKRLKFLVKTSVPELWIRGEISNLKTYSSGHTYFTLKDSDASISAVIFKMNMRGIGIDLKDGMKILVYGEVSVYEQRGTYQIIVRHALADGVGDLAQRFEALKAKFFSEGLFDEDKKQSIPSSPKNIAVITSPTGAAIQDFLSILKKRAYSANVYILPSKVQGNDAVADLIKALDFVAKNQKKFDLVILMRGGGSLEDLWCFNDENLIRKIAEIKLPSISAVGHQVDFTLCDFVADLRTETPSAAAEYICNSNTKIVSDLEVMFSNIFNKLNNELNLYKTRLKSCENLFRLNNPISKIQNLMISLDKINSSLEYALKDKISEKKSKIQDVEKALIKHSPENDLAIYKNKLAEIKKRLSLLSVEATMNRGFARVFDKNKNLLSSTKNLTEGELVNIEFSSGKFSARVEDINS